MGDELTRWDYDASVKKMRRWKISTIDGLVELYTAREELSRPGTRSDLVSNETRSWTDYLDDIGLSRATVHRWLSRFNPETKQIEDGKAHVAANSGESEWYTPTEYVNAARAVMGTIDTDPASCEKANETVGASTFYDADTDGRTEEWSGNVWMNPPYKQPLVSDFCTMFLHKWKSGEFTQGCILINNATETEFGSRLLRECSAVCFPTGRIKFIDPGGNASGAPLQGQMIVYFGPNVDSFKAAFDPIGPCKV